MTNDPHIRYFKQCSIELELALPILEKVHDQTLKVHDFNISNTQMDALIEAASFFKDYIKRFLLDNCGIDDKKFSKFLIALGSLPDFKSIIYRNNHFDMESARALLNLLYKKMPHHLDELCLERCKTSYMATEYLLERLCDRSYLSHLALVSVELSERSISLLCDFVTNNRLIQQLDLSWN